MTTVMETLQKEIIVISRPQMTKVALDTRQSVHLFIVQKLGCLIG